jgi:hypothetical protein
MYNFFSHGARSDLHHSIPPIGCFYFIDAAPSFWIFKVSPEVVLSDPKREVIILNRFILKKRLVAAHSDKLVKF